MPSRAPLNEAQTQAVETVYGPILILAGPGTGKTELLTRRIEYLINAGIGAEPSNILCLTFTDSGAVAMRHRLAGWLGSAAYQINVTTFHGFCAQLARDYSPHFARPEVERATVLTDLEQAQLFAKISAENSSLAPLLDPYNRWRWRGPVFKALSDLRREGVSIQSFRERLPDEAERLRSDPENFYKRKTGSFAVGDWKAEKKLRIKKQIARLQALADFWEHYETAKSQQHFQDFDDQLLEALQALQNSAELRAELQERYQWILVDEYQDTNGLQNQLLWELTDQIEAPNILAVGDDDQSIYRFQGASTQNMLEFQERFSPLTMIHLTENYRSESAILDASYQLVQHNADRLDPNRKLSAKANFPRKNEPAAQTLVFADPAAEKNFILRTIKNHLQAGVPPQQIAILLRTNAQREDWSDSLKAVGVPVCATTVENVLDHPLVQSLSRLLRVFDNPQAHHEWFQLLYEPWWKFPSHYLWELSNLRGKMTVPQLFQALESGALKAEGLDWDLFDSWWKTLSEARQRWGYLPPEAQLERVFWDIGLGDFLIQQGSPSDWNAVQSFWQWVKDSGAQDLSALLETMDLYQELSLVVPPQPLPQDQQSVQVLTAHKSKGLEFSAVFIPQLTTRWSSNNRDPLALPPQWQQPYDPTAEHRRLLFVAMTRAKEHLYLSYAEQNEQAKAQSPCALWYDLNLEPSENNPADSEPLFPPVKPLSNQGPLSSSSRLPWIEEKLQHWQWSASKLNAFLDCPRRFLFTKLFAYPPPPTPPRVALGNALHHGLEQFWKETPSRRSLPVIEEHFTQSLQSAGLELQDFRRLNAYGKQLLARYYQERLEPFLQTPPESYELEYNFSAEKIVVDGDLLITGKIDRIDYLDGNKKTIRVVDYKTSAPKKIAPDSSWARQLVFYDLLARNSRHAWQPVEWQLEFLTPNAKDELETVGYEVTAEHRAALLSQLKQVHQQLLNYDFPLVDPEQTFDPEATRYFQSLPWEAPRS